jgi:hypothetical protein
VANGRRRDSQASVSHGLVVTTPINGQAAPSGESPMNHGP